MQRRSIKTLAILPTLPALALFGSCKNVFPDLTAVDGAVSGACQTYSDLLVSYNPAGSEGGSDAGLAALGVPDSMTVTVDTNTVLTVGFVGLGGLVDDMTDDDLLVHGTASDDAEIAVYAGPSLNDMRYTGAIDSNSFLVNLSTGSVTRAVYVRLVGIAGSAEIDAFESVHTLCPTQ
jgi:hypothetical protein